MLSIRLSRQGRKKAPVYRVVVMEKSRDPQARHLEILGNYNPRSTPKTIELKEDRIKYWLSVGAQPSNTVANLIANAGITSPEKKAKAVRITKKRQAKMDEKNAEVANAKAEAEDAKKAEAEAEANAEAPVEEAPAEAEAPMEAPAEEVTEKPKEDAKPEEAEAPSEETKESAE